MLSSLQTQRSVLPIHDHRDGQQRHRHEKDRVGQRRRGSAGHVDLPGVVPDQEEQRVEHARAPSLPPAEERAHHVAKQVWHAETERPGQQEHDGDERAEPVAELVPEVPARRVRPAHVHLRESILEQRNPLVGGWPQVIQAFPDRRELALGGEAYVALTCPFRARSILLVHAQSRCRASSAAGHAGMSRLIRMVLHVLDRIGPALRAQTTP